MLGSSRVANDQMMVERNSQKRYGRILVWASGRKEVEAGKCVVCRLAPTPP